MSIWWRLHTWMMERRCDERRKYKTCSCRNRRCNPCERAEVLAMACEAIAEGRPTDVDPEAEILSFVRYKMCRNGQCNHRGCANAAELASKLERTLKMAVAA